MTRWIRASLALAGIALSIEVIAADWSRQGMAAIEARAFGASDPGFAGRGTASVRLEGRFDRSGDTRLTLRPMLTIDARDERRSRLDVAELRVARDLGDGVISGGLLQVAWGVMDARSNADILNQWNLTDDPLDPERLAVPALRYRGSFAGVGVDAVVASGFRQRVLPGPRGRVGLPLPVRDEPRLLHPDGHALPELGLRLDRRFGATELAVSWFDGYARAPEFEPVAGGDALQAHYALMEQLALEWRRPVGDWLLRGEAFHRSGQQGGYGGVAVGLERIWFGSRATVTTIAEFYHDDRGDAALPAVLEHDMVLIARLDAHGAGDARIEARLVQDLHVAERLWQFQVDRRVGRAWRAGLEAVVFDTDAGVSPVAALLDPDRKFAFLAAEDYVAFRFERHF